MSDEFEELEQIPWAALAASTPSPRNRYIGIAVAVTILLVAVGWIAIRSDNAAAVSLAPPEADRTPAVSTQAPTTTPPATASVYSEADLMLIDAGDEERLAVMHAEWLVRDVLTIDGDQLVEERIDELLPEIERPVAPSYVEWVKAFAVESAEPGRYRVEVAYRTLMGTPEGYVRQPPGAMVLEVAIDVGGSARLVSAPEPVPLPLLASVTG